MNGKPNSYESNRNPEKKLNLLRKFRWIFKPSKCANARPFFFLCLQELHFINSKNKLIQISYICINTNNNKMNKKSYILVTGRRWCRAQLLNMNALQIFCIFFSKKKKICRIWVNARRKNIKFATKRAREKENRLWL